MHDGIRIIVSRELNNNESVTLPDLYKIIFSEIESVSKTRAQMKHRVRSVLDGYRLQGKSNRIAPLTYAKTVDTI